MVTHFKCMHDTMSMSILIPQRELTADRTLSGCLADGPSKSRSFALELIDGITVTRASLHLNPFKFLTLVNLFSCIMLQ